MNMNFYTVVARIQSGVRPSVEFTKKIEECESYPEGGMRATIIGAEVEEDGVVKLLFDYTTFDEFNLGFESHNYYDRGGIPCLTAREANMYHTQEWIYLMGNDKADDFFVDINPVKAHAAYLASGSKESYVTWLEGMVNKILD